jgi:hypothetical protein
MAKKEKLKRIISHENLDDKILDMFNKKYPNGYGGFIQNIPSPKGEMLHVVPLETEDSIYLVKVKVQANGKKGRDEDDDEFFGDEIPEAGDGFDGDKDEFNANEDEEDNYGDGPAEEMGEEDEEED